MLMGLLDRTNQDIQKRRTLKEKEWKESGWGSIQDVRETNSAASTMRYPGDTLPTRRPAPGKVAVLCALLETRHKPPLPRQEVSLLAPGCSWSVMDQSLPSSY